MLGRGDDAEAQLRVPLRDAQEQLEVAARVGADGEDVDVGSALDRPKRIHVDAERDEHDAGSGAEPGTQPVRLALGVRDDRSRVGEARAVEPPSSALPRNCTSRSGSPIAVYTIGVRTRPTRAAAGSTEFRPCRRSRARRRAD